MESKIPKYYSNYTTTLENFKIFHNQVINMPRDKFSNATFEKIRSLSSYLLLIKKSFDNKKGQGYKEILGLIIKEISSGIIPLWPDKELEERYFRNDIPLASLYDKEGRMFRHLMEILAFFCIIKSYSKQEKYIEFETCKEITLSDNKLLLSIFRNNLLSDNIANNDYIRYLKSINLNDKANYRPAYSILKYIKSINRPATLFEISVLLGRIDEIQTEKEILKRAIDIAAELPKNQDAQIEYFFKSMNWKNNNNNFQYKPSQEPYFKFNSFILYMCNFELLNLNETENTVTLSVYSEKLLEDEIPIELLDLEELLYKIDDDNENESELMNIIINKRNPQISKAINDDSILIEKINKRSLRNVNIDDKGKRKRNKFITELAKLKANYTCEATGKKTFKMPNGQYYVEAHHLIEFSNDGPDITENLIVLGPEKHMLLHHACQEEREDLYNHLKTIGVINAERFKKMNEIYKCLNEKHINILFDKKLISSIQKEEMLNLLKQD